MQHRPALQSDYKKGTLKGVPSVCAAQLLLGNVALA